MRFLPRLVPRRPATGIHAPIAAPREPARGHDRQRRDETVAGHYLADQNSAIRCPRRQPLHDDTSPARGHSRRFPKVSLIRRGESATVVTSPHRRGGGE